MVDLIQAHKASIELLGTRHTALVEAVRNYVNGSVQPSIDELVAAIEDVTTDIDTKEKMLLGLASRQATKPVPSLILDFKTRHYLQGTRRPEKGYRIHDLLTVERATPKWVMGPQGKLVEAPPNTLAYEYDPVTGAAKGVLIEESSTNLLVWSGDFTNEVWDPQNASTEVEVYQGGSPAPSAYLVKATQSFSYSTAELRQTGLSINEGPLSIFLLCKPLGEVNGVGFFTSGQRKSNYKPIFDFRDKTISAGDGNIVELNDGWFLCEMTDVATSSGGEFFGFRPAKDGQVLISANEGEELMLVALAQYEQGSTPSSYIPTTDSPVTRAADSVYRALGAEYNPHEGTVLVECDVSHIRTSSGNFATGIASWGEPSRDNTFTLYTGGSGRDSIYLRIYGAVGAQTLELGNRILGGVDSGRIKIAATYNVTTGTVTAAALGQASTETWDFDGYTTEAPELLPAKLGKRNEQDYAPPVMSCGDLRYIPRALTEQELLELTS